MRLHSFSRIQPLETSKPFIVRNIILIKNPTPRIPDSYSCSFPTDNTSVMVLTCVMLLTRVMVLSCFMMLARVMVLASFIVLVRVMSQTFAWVTRSERPKGAKSRGAKLGPGGP